MKKRLGILAILLVLAVALAGAEPIGLTVGTRVYTGDLTGGFSLKLKPYFDYALGTTGFYAGADWDMSVYSFNLGILEAYEEYDFSAAGLDFAAGNYNGFELPTSTLYGSLYGTAAYGLPIGLTPKLELDFNYAPWWSLDSYLWLIYKTDLGPGKLGAEARLYAPILPSFRPDRIRCRVNYTLPVGPVNVKAELEPTIVFSPFAVQIAPAIYVSMDL